MSIARVALPSVLLLLFSVVTCAEQPMTKTSSDSKTPEPDTVAAKAPAKASEESQAVGETCEDIACQSNSDCCKGYACGFDAERSHVQRYCLGQ